jgi:hypothetical protein
VRTGYLDALAARALGAAPLLRPVTPSRFEPEGPTGRLEVLEIVEPAADVPHVEQATPARPPSRPEPPLVPVDGQLFAPVEPDLGPLVAVRPGPPPAPAVEREPTADSDTAPVGIATLARAVDTERAGPTPALALRDAVMPRADAAPADPARPGARERATEPSWEPEEPAPPAVVVRIGRIEVRAEGAPRTTAVPRQPPVQAGRSLADHLLARDRELS